MYFNHSTNTWSEQWDELSLYTEKVVSIFLTVIKGQSWPYTRINNNHVKPTAVHTNWL